MRNQYVAGLFCCITAQASVFTVWANCDIHRDTCWADPIAQDYYQQVARSLIDHWSKHKYLGYEPDLPEFCQ